MTRVMKDWSDLEERYQDMRLADPKSAQAFKQKMTARFQVVKNSNIGAHEDIKEINFVFFLSLLDIRSGSRGGRKCREASIGRHASTTRPRTHQST